MEEPLTVRVWQTIMSVIYSNESKYCISDIAHKIKHSGPFNIIVIANLEKAGLITKTTLKSNKRRKVLSLTDKGRPIAKCCYELLEAKRALIEEDYAEKKQPIMETARFC